MDIKEIKDKVTPLLLGYEVRRAGIFGSVTKANDTPKSDIDSLVELNSKTSLLDFVGMKLGLEELLGRTVDLVEYQAIMPRLKEKILGKEIRIYGKKINEMSLFFLRTSFEIPELRATIDKMIKEIENRPK